MIFLDIIENKYFQNSAHMKFKICSLYFQLKLEIR